MTTAKRSRKQAARDAEAQHDRTMALPTLMPVAPGQRLSLGDRAAAAPASLPPRKELAEHMAHLLTRLESLQADFHADGRRALLLVLQGRDAAGKDGTIRTVLGACNPMGVRVAAFGPPSTRERSHDYLWRVHKVMPARGVIGVFNRSHYEDVLVVRVRGLAPAEAWKPRFRQIADFERMLVENDTVIVKCFLHLSRDEQKVRLQERLDDPRKNWKFRLGDLEDRAHWDDYTAAYRDVLAKTSTPWAPWYVVPSDDKRARNYFVARLLVDALASLDLRYPRMDPGVAEAARGFA
jgi:PPK2 family polyphosphate:nucleotide phosphotransferase